MQGLRVLHFFVFDSGGASAAQRRGAWRLAARLYTVSDISQYPKTRHRICRAERAQKFGESCEIGEMVDLANFGALRRMNGMAGALCMAGLRKKMPGTRRMPGVPDMTGMFIYDGARRNGRRTSM